MVVCNSSPTSLTFPIRARQSLQPRPGGDTSAATLGRPSACERRCSHAGLGILAAANPCDLLCHLQKPRFASLVCRSLTAGVACAASCSWMCALPGPVALPPRQRPGCTGHAHTRGDPPLPTHLEVPIVPLEILQPIECAASRLVARPRRLACVVSWPLAEDWRWGLT